MNLVTAISIIQLHTGEELTKKDFAKKVEVTEQAIQPYRKNNKKQIPENWIELLVKEYGNIFPSDEKTVNSSNKYVIVPYFSVGNAEFYEKLISEKYTVFLLDLQFVIDNKLKPENLVVIAMMGEEMDGDIEKIKNKNLLLVDTSKNDIHESGIFFCTSHGNTRAYVRRIVEIMTDDVCCITTVDNPLYKKIIERPWTIKEWEDADIKVIGRVIKNLSYLI